MYRQQTTKTPDTEWPELFAQQLKWRDTHQVTASRLLRLLQQPLSSHSYLFAEYPKPSARHPSFGWDLRQALSVQLPTLVPEGEDTMEDLLYEFYGRQKTTILKCSYNMLHVEQNTIHLHVNGDHIPDPVHLLPVWKKLVQDFATPREREAIETFDVQIDTFYYL